MKRPIGEIYEMIREVGIKGKILASIGEDSAVIKVDDQVILFAADGISQNIVKVDPWWAGYVSVLVNVNDILGTGGIPLTIVNVLSCRQRKKRRLIMKGMLAASSKFGVPIVGGHIHPDTQFTSIDVAIIGIAREEEILYSHRAKPNESLVVGIDLKGKIHPKIDLNWDSTTFRGPLEITKQMKAIRDVSKNRLASSGKDISTPGVIGTIGMLLETSRVGAEVDITKIPRPSNVEISHWLKVYPGVGFIFASREPRKIVEMLTEAGITTEIVGKFTAEPVLRISDGKTLATVFDFRKNKITGIKPR